MTDLEPMPQPGKPAVRSATCWGLATTALGLVLPPLLGRLHVVGPEASDIVDGAGRVMDGLGLILAAIGRVRAAAPLTSLIASKG